MNERIKELILKAGWQNAYTDPKEGFELVFENEEHNLECVKKFAEMIVRECGDYADWYQDNYTDTDIGKAIKRHFGVES
jgi:hypothetical protein